MSLSWLVNPQADSLPIRTEFPPLFRLQLVAFAILETAVSSMSKLNETPSVDKRKRDDIKLEDDDDEPSVDLLSFCRPLPGQILNVAANTNQLVQGKGSPIMDQVENRKPTAPMLMGSRRLEMDRQLDLQIPARRFEAHHAPPAKRPKPSHCPSTDEPALGLMTVSTAYLERSEKRELELERTITVWKTKASTQTEMLRMMQCTIDQLRTEKKKVEMQREKLVMTVSQHRKGVENALVAELRRVNAELTTHLSDVKMEFKGVKESYEDQAKEIAGLQKDRKLLEAIKELTKEEAV
ncbi:hypothetical protein EJ05DRAFT_496420 [Pseudovirgaria hyperparasitica]|uniref:Uncharacterized protein n=1 Tax=Pseudovirgaria hyperparasitica TaxID=470096 RepID=A0A6A6WIK1_9PEZI|nr:uncharacterized protein EJ05DRAFT_496420 [Pseudovirgaria hyperparasitica]KAF2761507.1 hypothetical protein EJ05DRAFT_496420 [Pseudovirgaria hyperparasitica]